MKIIYKIVNKFTSEELDSSNYYLCGNGKLYYFDPMDGELVLVDYKNYNISFVTVQTSFD